MQHGDEGIGELGTTNVGVFTRLVFGKFSTTPSNLWLIDLIDDYDHNVQTQPYFVCNKSSSS